MKDTTKNWIVYLFHVVVVSVFTFISSFGIYIIFGDDKIWLSASINGGIWGVMVFQIMENMPLEKISREYYIILKKTMYTSVGFGILFGIIAIISILFNIV